MEEKDYSIIKNYYLEEYNSIIKYILTYDTSLENKYIINIKSNSINEEISTLSITINPNKNNYNYSVSKEIQVNLPNHLIKEIIDSIRENFNDNHYIIYSSLNINLKTQTLQNEKFTLYIKLTPLDDISEISNFNMNINSNKRHKTKALSLK